MYRPPNPYAKPPPWIQTSTGKGFWVLAIFGTYIFKCKQSSDPTIVLLNSSICGHLAESSNALKMSSKAGCAIAA